MDGTFRLPYGLPKDKGLPTVPPRLYLEDEDFQPKDKGLPMLPPRLYLEDEDFTSQLHDNTKQNTASNFQEKAVCFQVCGSVIQTHELQSPTVNENVYQPLLPNRRVTQESSESTVYQPITPGGTTNHKEEKEKWTRLATGIKNSTYQSHTFKSPARNGEQNQDKRGQLISAKESSERCTNHYQPLVFSKGKQPPLLHINDDILDKWTRLSLNRNTNSTEGSVRI